MMEYPGPIDAPYHLDKSINRYSSPAKSLAALVSTIVLLEVAEAIRSRVYPITRTKLEKLGPGLLGITTMNIYHAGEVRFERIAFRKIVSLVPDKYSLRIRHRLAEGESYIRLSNIDGILAHRLITSLLCHEG